MKAGRTSKRPQAAAPGDPRVLRVCNQGRSRRRGGRSSCRRRAGGGGAVGLTAFSRSDGGVAARRLTWAYIQSGGPRGVSIRAARRPLGAAAEAGQAALFQRPYARGGTPGSSMVVAPWVRRSAWFVKLKSTGNSLTFFSDTPEGMGRKATGNEINSTISAWIKACIALNNPCARPFPLNQSRSRPRC